MEKTFFQNLTVGAEVVFQRNWEFSLQKVTKVNPKSVVVNGQTFYLDKWDTIRHRKANSYSSTTYAINPVTQHYLNKIKETEQHKLNAEVERQNKAACEASDAEEQKAFYATEDGQKFLAQENDWAGYKLDTNVTFGNSERYDKYFRTYTCYILHPRTGRREAEFTVKQAHEGYWETDKPCIIKKSEIDWNGAREMSSKQTEAFISALNTCTAIANFWDKEVGKIWKTEARLAVGRKTYCVVCEDNDNAANVTSDKCSDYCQEVHERNSGEI